MKPAESARRTTTDRGNGTTAGSPARRLLVVEPEALVRWSLGKYLSRWFIVHCVDSLAGADRVLEDHPIDAVIVSDHPNDRLAEDVEAIARARNASVRVIRTVTDSPGEPPAAQSPCVEKPFELSKLARLLGIKDPSAPRQ